MTSSDEPTARARRRWLATAIATGALLSVPAAAIATHVFTDVPDGYSHAPGIHYVADTGITLGCSSDEYCPSDPLTRAQMGTFLFRASGNDPATPPSVNADRLRGLTPADLARADDVPQAETVTETTGCVGHGFFPLLSTHEYGALSNQGRYLLNGGTAGLRCPVSLPDGARITGARFRVSDSSTTTGIASVSVNRRPLLGTVGDVVGRVDDVSSNAATPGSFAEPVAIDPAFAVVDNGTYAYSLEIGMGHSNEGARQYVAIYGAELTYEVERLVVP